LAAALGHFARYRPIIDDWDAFAEALARPLPPCIWANPSRITPEALGTLLADEGIGAAPLPWRPEAFRLDEGLRSGRNWWFCAGLAHSQEEVSQVPVTLLDLAPGQRVLDMCAAPGGKTAQIAFALGNRGTVVANDFARTRIKALQGNLDRLGVANVTTTCRDAANWPAGAGQFDRILVDAPCSSEGTLRRNPGMGPRLTTESSERLAPRQRALLRKAVQRARPGGRIVYSTCTFAPDENELVVAAILEEYAGRVRLVPAAVPGLRTAPGVTGWQGQGLDPALAGCLRIWPHHNDTGGFFVAVLEKDPDAPWETEPEPAALAAEPDDGEWIDGLSCHFGLPADLWPGYRVHRQTSRGLHLTAADHAPPAAAPGEASGLFFFRTQWGPPKITTAGAMLLGPQATRAVLPVDPAQRDAFLARREIVPTAAQAAATPVGQVIVTYRGHPLGIAVHHRSGTIESFFPSRWSGCIGL
jgi:NOL1/NOP2/sun family putative RNA methylase